MLNYASAFQGAASCLCTSVLQMHGTLTLANLHGRSCESIQSTCLPSAIAMYVAEHRSGRGAQVAAIGRYDGRSAMGLSEAVKAQHRLPFFANFAHLAARIEQLLGTLDPSPPGALSCARPGSLPQHPCQLRTLTKQGRAKPVTTHTHSKQAVWTS